MLSDRSFSSVALRFRRLGGNTSMSTGTHPAQVQRYLPFKLYNELILNPGPESLGHCVEHLTALLQTVETYCSAPVLAEAQKPPHNVQGQWLEATLLFADISGFTAMSERLNARGRAPERRCADQIRRRRAAGVVRRFTPRHIPLRSPGRARHAADDGTVCRDRDLRRVF
jgi:hypothetical protein